MLRLVACLQLVVGMALVAVWSLLLATGQVPEVQQGRVDIWFHVAAEMVMAGLLLAAGTALLRRAPRARLLSALALGWLGYSAVNSPGYYAQTGEWAVVGMFGLAMAATAGAVTVLWRQAPETAAPPSHVRPTPSRLTPTGTGREP
jgi:hypothetical protein